MKEFFMIVGFGAGLVTGMLLYKHSQDAKKIVNKGEQAVKKEMDNISKTISDKGKNVKQKNKA